MTIRFIGNNFDGVDAQGDGDLWVLQAGRTLATSIGEGVAFDFLGTADGELIVEGSVLSAEAAGIASGIGSYGNTVLVGTTGFVEGATNAIEMTGDAHMVTNLGEVHGGIRLTGDSGEILNGGAVQGGRIKLIGDFGTISNDGEANRGITSIGESNIVANQGDVRGGVRLIGDQGQILNLNGGEIRGTGVGVTVEGNSNTFRNSGYIESDLEGVLVIGTGNELYNRDSIAAGTTGVAIGGESNKFLNTGFIVSDAEGVLVTGTDNKVNNRDKLVGGTAGVVFDTDEGESNTLVNAGRGIILSEDSSAPAVVGGDGDEVVINKYIIDGEVLLNGGNDVYDGRDAVVRQFEDNEFGEPVWTFRIADTVDGGLGNDELTGSRFQDVLLGGGGNDVIRGAKGSDNIAGGSGNDRLIGGVGADFLEGNGGDDRLAGRAGSDTLTGGKGADTFVFGADYYVVSNRRDTDVITDFEDGIDKIDMTSFGTDFAAVEAAIDSDEQGDARIDLALLGGTGVIVLEGVAPGQLDASDFFL